jgi:hypothetical protein
LSEFGDALGCHNLSRLEEFLEVVDLEVVDGEGGAMADETLFGG